LISKSSNRIYYSIFILLLSIFTGALFIIGTGGSDSGDGALTWYLDSDGDGYGDPFEKTTSKTQPTGYMADNTDCYDDDSSIHPGAAETADDGIDQDCDGSDLTIWYLDSDGDGYGDPSGTTTSVTQPTGYVADDTDCDDTDAGINPGATELADNGIDQDCDGTDLPVWYKDEDSDGFGDPSGSTFSATQPTGYVTDNTDCDDTDAGINSGATEIADDGIDQDCTGFDLQTWYLDADGDLYSEGTSQQAETQPTNYYLTSNLTATSGDCDDDDAGINSGATEIPDDGIDQDCTGFDGVTYYEDSDSDGYGNPASTVIAEGGVPTGYVTDNIDCDDTDAGINPGATEDISNGVDDDCDGHIDEVTYKSHIKDILDNFCINCHGSNVSGSARNGAPAGVNFNTYALAKPNANAANTRIQNNTMPKGSPALSSENKDLFQAWIDKGILE